MIWAALDTVTDPEIPVISIVEMGMVPSVLVDGDATVVRMTPTFAGCPALDVIRQNIVAAVKNAGYENVRVDVVFDPPWTSDRITDVGREKLKSFGLAPPGAACGSINELRIAEAACPLCDSTNTTLESIFGPTLCRAIHYCNDCQQSFEQFKPV
ncbi:MAG: phenylacetate-CoA oxygenase subunit PaaJ [Planctomycetes bacterium]|nr:phenylacetate-CoA oxygenase subunit PaaJ [Planctomycetota bacterium]